MIGNSDVFGNPLFGRDKYGKPIPAQTQGLNLLNEALGSFAPSSIQNVQGVATGKQSALQAATQASGLPVAFKNENPTAQTLNDPHSQAVANFRPTFDKIQSLVKSGQKDQALQMVNALSPSDYKLYQGLKAGATRTTTTKSELQFLPTYQEIKGLLNQGKTDEAMKRVNALSDAEYKLYQALRKKGL